MLRPLRPLLTLCLLAYLAPVYAQNVSGTLTGTVKDPAGSAIPRAQIALTNQATGAIQTITSNEAGLFVFSSVLP